MTGSSSIRVAVALLCFLALLVFGTSASAQCNDVNLLSGASVVDRQGFNEAKRLTDEWGAPEGSSAHALEAAVFTYGEYVTWDLGKVSYIDAADFQADNNDNYQLQGSSDGNTWQLLWEVPVASDVGLRGRAASGINQKVRFVKLLATGGDGVYSATELRLFCKRPESWPTPRLTSLKRVEDPDAIATYQAFTGKIVLALLGLFLVFAVAPRLRDKWRRMLLIFVLLMSSLGWTHFGQFQGKTVVHPWDMFHYYMGSKYYEELGYFDLYRCVAKSEREQGNADKYKGILIRNLDDNKLFPFSWTGTEDGRCRASFDKSRWESFQKDIEAFRPLMQVPPFEHVVGDHGFNATPFHATWLGWMTNLTDASTTVFRVLAQVDSLALIASLGALAWGFGLPTAAVAALLIQVGAPWSYNWIGGGLGRHVWFALVCLGLALLKKRRMTGGTAALTAATLLRFQPLVMLGGLGIYFIFEWVRQRELSLDARRALFGFFGTLSLGLALVLVSHGPQPLRSFVDVVTEHADSPASNRLGFPHLLSIGPGKRMNEVADPRLTDPSAPWKDVVRSTVKERKPLWYLALGSSFALLFWVVYAGRSPWVSVLATGPLLYSLQSMTSYDYVWLVLLTPFGLLRPRALAWLCGFAIFTQVVGIADPDLESRHWWYALGLFSTVIVFGRELFQWGKNELKEGS